LDIDYELTERQSVAWKHLFAHKDVDLLYGGAKGGGKSYLFCVWAFLWARELINILKIPLLKNPLAVGFIGRKRGVDFDKTTLETWKKTIPESGYYIREQPKEIVIENRVKLFFGGLDDQKNINKFNSAELAFFGIDQAEETERTDIGVIEASIRLMYNGIQPPYKSLYTANPAECWLKEDFVNHKRDNALFVKALPTDNPYLPDGYIERLEKSFRYDPVLLQAYRDGNWDVTMASYQVIPSKQMDELAGYTHHPEANRFAVVCDPSTGGDECVIYLFEHYIIRDVKILHTDDTMVIVGEMQIMGNSVGAEVYGVDEIGIGKGIKDRLSEIFKDRENRKVIGIGSAKASSEPERFDNLRAEIWWNARELVIEHRAAYPKDEELRRQACAVKFKPVSSNGKIKLELKSDTKSRIGRSPDRADTWVYGLWVMKKFVKSASAGIYRDRRKHQTSNKGYDALNYSG